MLSTSFDETAHNSPQHLQAIFTPTWPKNPYHQKLIAHLKKHNVDVLPDTSMKHLLRAKTRGSKIADIIHLHTLSKFQFSLGMIIRLVLLVARIKRLRRHGVKFLMTVHDLFPHETVLPLADLWIGRTMGRLMDGLFVHSLSAKKKLMDAWEIHDDSRIEIIPHPHFIDCYPNSISRTDARIRLDLKEAEIVFLFLGQIRPYKGIDELLDGFALLKEKRFKLMIVGEAWTTQLASELSQRCKNDSRIQLRTQFVPSEDVQIYMNASDIVVLPYRRAFTSGAALLAMSFAKPCIATNIDSFPDVLDHNGAFFCEANNPQSISAAFQAAANAHSELSKMGRYNFARASQWQWDDMARSLARSYRENIASVSTET